MQTKTYFFNESSKKTDILNHLNVNDKKVQEYINTITKIQSGNKIGYFQFKISNTFYKFYIMPKIFKIKEGERESQDDKKSFINFFKHYYRVIIKYNINNSMDKLESNISDLGYLSNKNSSLSFSELNDIDDFIVYDYLNSINIVKTFIRKHYKSIQIEKEYSSQNIKNKLNIKRNILSLNKTEVHQVKKSTLIYSKIALISLEVLKFFINKKVKNFSNNSESIILKKETNKLINKILKKYPNSKDSFSVQEILSKKVSKLFQKNNEYKKLYISLLKLMGKEHYYNGDKYIELKKEETIALFFNPAKLYEWLVYDMLIESKEFDKVLKCDKDDIKKEYFIEPNKDSKYSSEPDLLVIKNNKLYPIDAKWKILVNKDSSFDNDIFKLRRDALIRNSNKGFLVYPKIESSNFNPSIEYNYSFDNNFKFEVRVMNVL